MYLYLGLVILFTGLFCYFRVFQKDDKYTAIFFGVLVMLSFLGSVM